MSDRYLFEGQMLTPREVKVIYFPSATDAQMRRGLRKGITDCVAMRRYRQDERLSGKKPCPVDDCGRPAIARGLCNMHYQHAMREGDAPEVVDKESAVPVPAHEYKAPDFAARKWRGPVFGSLVGIVEAVRP